MKKKSALLMFSLPMFLMSVISCANHDESENASSTTVSTSAPVSESKMSSSGSVSSSSSKGEEVTAFTGVVRIYFHNDSGTEKSKAIYCWITGVNGEEYNWDGVEEGYGVYKDIDLSDPKFAGKVTDDFFFIIKTPNTWAGQSEDIKITLSDFLANGEVTDIGAGRKRINVYACEEASNAISTHYHQKEALGYRFSSLVLEKDWKTITVTSTGKCLSYSLYALDSSFVKNEIEDTEKSLKAYLIGQGEPNEKNFTIDLSECHYSNGRAVPVKPTITYQLFGHFEDNPDGTKNKCVSFDKIYDTEEFITNYTYAGDDLGVKYASDHTEWRVWSPVSIYAEVLVYREGTPRSLVTSGTGSFNDFTYRIISMKYAGGGVYSCSYQGDLKDCYYLYRLYYNGGYVDTADPYATACGVNGIRSAIVDFPSLNPDGWDNVAFDKLNSPNELTAYEVHIRDLTSHATWSSRNGNERGGYNAFHEKGTGYNGVKTGFDHIKELGVNAVQILPFFDQDNDERTITSPDGSVSKPAYNWGYNPLNYNCLEGAYSSDPFDAKVRVKEFKSLVKDYAEAGIRVIMDVVYNHVSSASSHAFSATCPRYYFRYDDKGYLIDDTGCANTINSSRIMASRFIVNSVKWWAKEYKIKGFRFDLMGCLETSTMRAVKDTLYDIDPEIVVYGEGWTGGGSHANSASDSHNIYAKLGDNGKGAVGSFNDCYRDGMKGNTTYSDVTPSGGFMNAITPSDDEIWNSATGMIGENRWRKQSGVATPAAMTVNYLTCHDNYTLYDQLNYLLNGVSECDKENKNAKDAALASQANALMGQGIGFIQGGEEFFRTKVIRKSDENFDALVSSYKHATNGKDSWIEGDGIKINDDAWLVRNSYKYGDDVNGFDWSRKVNNEDYFEKFKAVIALRNSSMGTFLGRSQKDIDDGTTICLGGSAIGGGFFSMTGKKRIVLTSGKNKGSVNHVPSALQGEYKVVYCSSSRLEEGSNYTVYESTGIDATYETLILEK